MAKKAVLVTISLTTRVIVEDNASGFQVLDKARRMYSEKLKNELYENLVDITLDKEIPFGQLPTDFKEE